MPTISFNRKISATPEQYQKILDTTMPKEMLTALDEYRKNPYKEFTNPQAASGIDI